MSYKFGKVDVVVNKDSVETTMGKLVHRTALSETDATREAAKATGYGNDVRRYEVERLLLHTFLAQALGWDESPYLQVRAAGTVVKSNTPLAERLHHEPRYVMAFQRFMNGGPEVNPPSLLFRQPSVLDLGALLLQAREQVRGERGNALKASEKKTEQETPPDKKVADVPAPEPQNEVPKNPATPVGHTNAEPEK
jgi:hypothetical protein